MIPWTRIACTTALLAVGAFAQDAQTTDLLDLEKGCKQRKLEKCVTLGVALVDGDPVRAAKLFRIACDKDSGASCDNLGLMTARGLGVAADDAKAARLFLRACEKKAGLGCLHLAHMYFEGWGVRQNWKQTTKFYVKACDLGMAKGCERAADMYRTAPQVGIDPKKALLLEERARELQATHPDSDDVGGYVSDQPSDAPIEDR